MTALDALARHLGSTDPPFVELVVLPDAGDPLAALSLPPGLAVCRLDGRRCRTRAALFDELARGLAFPPHFGRNWDALEDLLNDLDWLGAAGHAIVVAEAQALLAGHQADYATLVSILEAAGREWATPRTAGVARAAAPFHALLAVAPRHVARRRDWRIPVRDLRG